MVVLYQNAAFNNVSAFIVVVSFSGHLTKTRTNLCEITDTLSHKLRVDMHISIKFCKEILSRLVKRKNNVRVNTPIKLIIDIHSPSYFQHNFGLGSIHRWQKQQSLSSDNMLSNIDVSLSMYLFQMLRFTNINSWPRFHSQVRFLLWKSFSNTIGSYDKLLKVRIEIPIIYDSSMPTMQPPIWFRIH